MEKNFDIMKETAESAVEYLGNLIIAISKISEYIQCGREDKAMNLCIDFFDGLKWLYEAVTLTQPLQKEFKTVLAYESVDGIFKQFEEAIGNKDYVFLSDLLEYELSPVLLDWQKKLLELLEKVGHGE